MPSFPPRRRASVLSAQFLTGALALGILIPCTLPSPALAQTSADTASIDRTLGPDAPAYHALMEGRVGDASVILRSTLAANPADATAHQLLCRVNYAQDQAEAAIHECELAASSQNVSSSVASDNHVWLGRAYGMKARHAGFIGGFTLARKVQSSFAHAVELNPNNVAALNDLGEYYVAAPFIVGGGDDKAQALADRIMPHFPAAAHRLLARLADSNNDPATAEAEFKRAVGVQGAPEAWIDLAQFYHARSRPDDALAAVKSALAADHTHGPVLVDAASILTESHRAPDLAERCLRDYLNSHAKSDEAPAFKVHLQLSRLLAARGDTKAANLEIAAAAALAPAFAHSGRSAQGL
jgi:tetratricopeptide (TPR) repeat protein